MHTELLEKDRGRRDEIGNLVAAFSAMEREIRSHFQKSDESIRTQYYTLDAIMCSMDKGVLLESPDGQIVYVNRIFSREVGIPQHEMINSRIQDRNLQEMRSTMLDRSVSYREAVEPIS